MNMKGFSPPLVDNRFDFESPTIYNRCVEPSFDWNRFRRSHLQFQKAEYVHDSHVYDRCQCSMVTSSGDSSPCLAHAANLYSQTKIDDPILPILSCPCMFCRKRFSERDRPQELLTKEDLKQLFPIRDSLHSKISPKTVTYLSRPSTAPFRQTISSLAHTSASRYIPTLKHSSRSNGAGQVSNPQSTSPNNLGMRLDTEPNHDHSQMFDLPRERDAVFRSLDDYFHMTSHGRPTMIL